MLLDLGTFASLLLSILCLCVTFHEAFFVPAAAISERLLQSLEMLAVSAAVCWGSGWLFCRWEDRWRWERRMHLTSSSIASSFPMKVFWWTSGTILVLFVISWYIEDYYLPLRSSLLGR